MPDADYVTRRPAPSTVRRYQRRPEFVEAVLRLALSHGLRVVA